MYVLFLLLLFLAGIVYIIYNECNCGHTPTSTTGNVLNESLKEHEEGLSQAELVEGESILYRTAKYDPKILNNNFLRVQM